MVMVHNAMGLVLPSLRQETSLKPSGMAMRSLMAMSLCGTKMEMCMSARSLKVSTMGKAFTFIELVHIMKVSGPRISEMVMG